MFRLTDLRRAVRVLCAAPLCMLALSPCAWAQGGFSSGSTGADGAFNPTASQDIVVRDGGVYNYTTVNIPSGVTITFLRNQQNNPVVILASGDVTISGSISVSGRTSTVAGGGLGGPGGFNGGAGSNGYDRFGGQPGDGPGGGGGAVANTNVNLSGSGGGGGGYAAAGAGSANGSFVAAGGQRYGTAILLPIAGGSGGGGGSGVNGAGGSGGGGGGGAVLIASSGRITINGLIFADGGGSGEAFSSTASGGGGAGGAIRLIANQIVGTGNLLSRGGGGAFGSPRGGTGSVGFIRLEAFNLTFTGNSTPAISTALPGSVFGVDPPALRITSVAGVAPPSAPSGSLQSAADVVVPPGQTNPVTVTFATANIPLGTTLQVTVTPGAGARTTVASSGITGTQAAGTASASVTLPDGMSVISATATFALPQTASAQPLLIDGERVERVEVAAVYGGASEVTYITRSGRRLKRTE